MDSIRIITFLLINMITLHLNLAATGDADVSVRDPVEGNILQPVYRRFEWRDLNGKPVRQSRSESVESDVEDVATAGWSRAVYWIPTTCDSMVERGYTCLGCGESLHCMGGGFALKAICMGRRPFCNNGICSITRGEKCNKNEDFQHQAAELSNGTEPLSTAATASQKLPLEDEDESEEFPDVSLSLDEAIPAGARRL